MKRIIHPPIAIDDECGEKCPQHNYDPYTSTFPGCLWANCELELDDNGDPIRCDKCIEQTKLEEQK